MTTPRSAPLPVDRSHAVRRLWTVVRPLLEPKVGRLWMLCGLSIIGGLAEASLLYLVVRVAVALTADKHSIDLAFGPLPHTDHTIPSVFVVALVMLLVMFVLSLVEGILSAHMAADALTHARKRLFAAYIASSWEVQSREREGRLQELMSNHTNRMANGVATLTLGVTALFNFLALLFSAVAVDPVAAGSSLLGVVVLFFLLRPLRRRTKVVSRESVVANVEYSRRMAETVGVAKEIKVFHVGEQLRGEISDFADEVSKPVYKTRLYARITPSIYQNAALLLVLAGMATVYALGLSQVSELGAVILLLVRSLSYSQQVQGCIQQASELAPYLEQIIDQTELYVESVEQTGDRLLDRVGTLELRGLSFGYTPDQRVLHELDVTIAGGETIGIVGPSGSGKSTLVQLLLRLRRPDAGALLVDGVPADEFDLASWYERFVFVPQDNRLLYATIADNIAFFRPWLAPDAIERAARLAHLHDEIIAFPDGYETVVGPGAQDISGGQKQRLALARALAGGPNVLVLDEPTSALDMRSERLVQQTLTELKGGVTLFIVAHRMSTLSICDKVLVLRKGHVEAFGPPDELRHSDGFYREALQLMAAGEKPAS